MTRNSILNKNFIVTSKFAKAILLKFLQENRCVKDFVVSYNFQHNSSFNCDQVVRRCIETMVHEWDGYLDTIFNYSGISFCWYNCEHIKSRDFWSKINSKWQKLVGGIVVSD